jgi:hypothetical protein
MGGPIPAWVLLAHDSRNISAIGILAGIRWARESDNDLGAHDPDSFNLLKVGRQAIKRTPYVHQQ